MPWFPELFSAEALAKLDARRHPERGLVPFFDGVMTGELAPLIGSFAGTPELHHPVRGRIRGESAFGWFADETKAWLAERGAATEVVSVLVTPTRGIEEVVVRLDDDGRRVELPVAIVSDRDSRGRIIEQRMYFSARLLNGTHAVRPPLLQASAGERQPDAVRDLHRAFAAGDADAAVAAFTPDAVLREPAGGEHEHRGSDELRSLFRRVFSDGGLSFEHCTVTDDGRACAVEYNVVGWGRTKLPPQAGVAVYVHADGGLIAAARTYDDVEPTPAVLASDGRD